MRNITFMDFCAGIGGGRLGLEKLGMQCIAFSEIDKSSVSLYKTLFGRGEQNYGDIRSIEISKVSDFDLMVAGFPCQSFSIAGRRKGLEDLRGQIIYDLIRILKGKDVPYFILENVKGLVNHNKGRTMSIIVEELIKAGYDVQWKVLDSLNYGVPQMRERVYFVGVRRDLVADECSYVWPREVKKPELSDYLIDTENIEVDPYVDKTFQKYLNNKYNKGKYDLDVLLNEEFLVLDTRQSDLRLYRGKVPTLRTGRHGILYVKSGKIKKLSGYESLLLQGFPKYLADRAKGSVSESKVLSQAGNAMTVSTIEAIGHELITLLSR